MKSVCMRVINKKENYSDSYGTGIFVLESFIKKKIILIAMVVVFLYTSYIYIFFNLLIINLKKSF